ncbi:MAG: ImmA/IrrE family metallo-endopeptidase [Steroidobacteraceae bacterium]
MRLQYIIDALEKFSAQQGVSVCRTPLHPWVVGRMDKRQIVLRSGLSKEQQLLTLVHELTHFLAHRPEAQVNRTVCEYEAEAVEKLVAGQLGLKEFGSAIDLGQVTDDLLACSVARVRWVARTLLAAVQDDKSEAPMSENRLQAQTAV